MTSKRWIGRWIIAVAALHTVFGLVVFHGLIAQIIQRGIWNSIGDDPLRGAVAWFLLAGGFMAVAGLAIDVCERSAVPLRSTGWSLLVVTLLTIVLMPVSGAWLLLPPALAMVLRGKPR